MKINCITITTLAATLSLFGCDDNGTSSGTPNGSDNPNSSDTGGSDNSNGSDSETVVIDHCADPVATTDEDGNVVVIAEDRLNYSFSSSLAVGSVPVRSGVDLTFDWSTVTKDLLGHDFDPLTSVDMMEISLWRYSKEGLMQDINNDALDTSNLVVLGQVPTGNAVMSENFLSLLSPSGSTLEEDLLLGYTDTTEYPLDEHTYLVMIAEGFILGNGTKILTFFDPSPTETNTVVQMTNDSTVLSYQVDMTSLKRIAVPPLQPNIILNWKDADILQKNAMGGTWIPTKITDVMVAQYIGKTPADLEASFLDLELIADNMYTAFLSAGQELNLKWLENDAGEAFPGIDENGTWIVALKCGLDCQNPAPWFLSILHPCN